MGDGVSFLTVLAVILLAWGVITLVRRLGDGDARELRADEPGVREVRDDADDDGIDYEELERAEEEVRDLDVNARPEDGFEGDDWGPGAPKRPPYA